MAIEKIIQKYKEEILVNQKLIDESDVGNLEGEAYDTILEVKNENEILSRVVNDLEESGVDKIVESYKELLEKITSTSTDISFIEFTDEEYQLLNQESKKSKVKKEYDLLVEWLSIEHGDDVVDDGDDFIKELKEERYSNLSEDQIYDAINKHNKFD